VNDEQKGHGSAVDIVTAYGPDDRGIGVPCPGRGKELSLLHIVQTSFGSHPASYTMGTGALSPGNKTAGA
jgi:hypothetical protein